MAKKLDEEIKQSQPFDTIEEEALLNLARTADRLQRPLRQVLKPHGLTTAQYNVLRILRGAGPNGLTCTELGERLVTEDPDITRLFDRLERQKLVRRRRDRNDRRVIHTTIGEAGLEKLKLLESLVLESVQRQLQHMSRERLSLLIELLEEAREHAV